MNSLKVAKLSKQLHREFRDELIRENSKRFLCLLWLVILSQIVFIPLELLHVLELNSSILMSRMGVIVVCSVFITTIYALGKEKRVKNCLSVLGLLISGMQFICLAFGCYFVVYMFNSEIHSYSAFLLVAFIVTLTCVRNPYFFCIIFTFFIGLTVYLHLCVESVSAWTGEFLIALVFVILLFIGNILNYNRHITLFLKEREISEMNQRLMSMSQTDELTGLYNRRKLVEVIEENINFSKRYNRSFCLAIMDLDYFKNINDLHGHNVGDDVLFEFSNRIRSMLRTTDVFGRWGGEEFLLLIPNSVQSEAYILLERLRNHVETTEVLPNIRITFSAGISCYQNDKTFNEIVGKADQALYAAKQSGRNNVICLSN